MILLIATIISLLAWPALGYFTGIVMAVNYIIVMLIVHFVENRKRGNYDGWDGYDD